MRCDPLVLFPRGGLARFPLSREAFPIVRRLQNSDQLLIQLQLTEGPRFYPADRLEPVPQVGDQVVVLAKPYTDWMYSQMQRVLYQSEGKKTAQYRKLADQLENFEWMATAFTVRRIEDGIAVIQGDGLRRELPVWTLTVLERKAT